MKGKHSHKAKHVAHHEEHKAHAETKHMKKGGKVEKKHEEKHVEGSKTKHRMDKMARGGKACYARGGQVVDGNKNVVKVANEKTESGVNATASTTQTPRPGFKSALADKSDD